MILRSLIVINIYNDNSEKIAALQATAISCMRCAEPAGAGKPFPSSTPRLSVCPECFDPCLEIAETALHRDFLRYRD